jgi:hypothetical protein
MPDHPHAEATYNLLTLDDGSFAAEVLIPGFRPTKVSGFDTREKAEEWIERHKANVARGTLKSPRPNWRTAKPR